MKPEGMGQRAWGRGHGAEGMGQRAWSRGHGAEGMEKGAWSRGHPSAWLRGSKAEGRVGCFHDLSYLNEVLNKLRGLFYGLR
ncbi:MAG TPA: hypothetical protein VLH37_03270 [Bacteroidales bacterium]|nr:hypothetical protein [Bacteroidales bacterium]